MVSKHGRVISPCYFGNFSHCRGYLSHPMLGKKFLPYFHTAVLHPVACARLTVRPCGSKKPVFNDLTGVVYLKSAELGMTYLDCTEWENAKYRKRDFFIRLGSDNARFCGV
ncbi:hypothetical protein GOBAR_AA01662 [Gossypium barbadense]|uniref:Uncharacterized protein n=1 Tax=Gossypium barbadense TaxID=3634 RepID=A0A2P5YTQ6_GOSBA|nr:hypothetical protein GOBAR_AA01662 [Gossypium barbadense]